MPYLKRADREAAVQPGGLNSPGRLNYVVTRCCLRYLATICKPGETPTYSDYNAVVGVLESAKLEFYRRMVTPYEHDKQIENGDVYEAPDDY